MLAAHQAQQDADLVAFGLRREPGTLLFLGGDGSPHLPARLHQGIRPPSVTVALTAKGAVGQQAAWVRRRGDDAAVVGWCLAAAQRRRGRGRWRPATRGCPHRRGVACRQSPRRRWLPRPRTGVRRRLSALTPERSPGSRQDRGRSRRVGPVPVPVVRATPRGLSRSFGFCDGSTPTVFGSDRGGRGAPHTRRSPVTRESGRRRGQDRTARTVPGASRTIPRAFCTIPVAAFGMASRLSPTASLRTPGHRRRSVAIRCSYESVSFLHGHLRRCQKGPVGLYHLRVGRWLARAF